MVGYHSGDTNASPEALKLITLYTALQWPARDFGPGERRRGGGGAGAGFDKDNAQIF